MRLYDILKEAHVSDTMPKQFQEFRQKYNRAKNKKNLYVQFTNHKDNTVDKTANQNPTDHSDFVGVYGYPLTYVLKHPSDIWYGSDAKYMRVLEMKNGKVLDFTGMNEQTAKMLINQFPVEYFRNTGISRNDVLDDIIAMTDFKGRNRWSRALLYLIQHGIDRSTTGRLNSEPQSGLEQTKLVKTLGYDVIIDRASSHKTATINDREPEQIIFLSRGSFRVLDIFTLNTKKDTNSSVGISRTSIDEKYIRKLAAVISNSIGTKLSQLDMKFASLAYAWTKRGDRIEFNIMEMSSAMDASKKGMDIKMGDKPHKYYKDTDGSTLIVTVRSPHGVIEYKSDPSDSIRDIASQIGSTFDSSSIDDSFVPESKESYYANLENQKEKRKQEEKEKKNRETIEYFNEFIIPVIKEYNITELLDYIKDDSNKIKLFNLLRTFFRRGKDTYTTMNEYLEMIESYVTDSNLDSNSEESDTLFDVLLEGVERDIVPFVGEMIEEMKKDGAKFDRPLSIFFSKMKSILA